MNLEEGLRSRKRMARREMAPQSVNQNGDLSPGIFFARTLTLLPSPQYSIYCVFSTKNGFLAATKLGTKNKIFVAETKKFCCGNQTS